MKIDLLHNKIVKDNITGAFEKSFRESLVPSLVERYGEDLDAVQMYEDYLADGFLLDGCFYYPLSLMVSGEAMRLWIKWDVSNKSDFEGGVPFAYVGEGMLDFEICDEAPEGFDERLMGRGIFFEGGCVAFRIEAASPDKTFLVGKYSQTFADELIRQISAEITSKFSLMGFEGSSVEIMLVFAPSTYMEHIFSGVTYRRLLISARGCNARDLWIKWYRTDGLEPITVSDNVASSEVTFEIGEDVPQKIREKEYRFLVHTSADKYQAAMGRKNITEWRDLIKRAIKRGELLKCEESASAPEKDADIAARLQEMLTSSVEPAESQVAEEPADSINSDLAALLKGVLGETDAPAEKDASQEAEAESFEAQEPAEESLTAPQSEDELRRRIEAEIRHELEREARMKAEAEAEELRRKHDELKAENERLAELARKAEEERIQREAERAAEAEKIKAEIVAREEVEARERERMAEAARLALIEQQRLAEERAEEERRRKIEEEKQRAEEAAKEAERLAEEKRLEEERIRAEEAARAEEERRRALEAAEAEKRAREEQRRAAEAKAAVEKMIEPEYTYVSKTARLLFRRPIDPNVTKRIHEIILSTIKYFHKENVYIKIKATVPDSTTVNLFFEKIPEEENELLINIIKVLGKSELGITKVYLE